MKSNWENMEKLLTTFLRSENFNVRLNAAEALSEIKSENAVDFLTDLLLGDKGIIVHRRATEALSKINPEKTINILFELWKKS